ncbi:hypothetical protein COO60DRAFT_14262 [Scenedesmus sp. NREL 46B-D3]|nr:hypothetical protein COO60DRAFT_14262 [Scenedesmus sp. NREL 46B-D3]
MQRLAEAGQADTPEGRRLVNEYRQATGEAKVQGVVEFVQGLPGLTAAAAAAAAAAADGEEQQRQGNDTAGSSAAAAAAGAAGGSTGSSSDGKLVVFAYHQQVLSALQAQLCEAQGLGFIRIDGKTQPQQRQQLVGRFQTDPSVRLALLSIKAAGTGLTLTAADRVVFAELHWNPSDLAQCEDRTHRVGQGRRCRVYYCMAPESADALMWGAVVRKLGVVGAAVDGARSGGAGQGLACMDSWQRQLTQPEEGEEPAQDVSGPGAAAAAAVGAARAEQHAGSQQQQQHSQGDGSQQLPAAAGGSAAASPPAVAASGVLHGTPRSRRSLLERFMEADEAPAAADAATARAAAAATALLAEPSSSAAAAAAAAAGPLPGSGAGSVHGSQAQADDAAAPARSTESLIEEAEAAAAAATAAAAVAAAAAATAAAAAAAVSAARGSVHSNAGSRSVSGGDHALVCAAASGASQPGCSRPAGSGGAGGSGGAAGPDAAALALHRQSQAGGAQQRLPTQGSQSTAPGGACPAPSQQAAAWAAAGRQQGEAEEAACEAGGGGGSQGSAGQPAKRQRQQ